MNLNFFLGTAAELIKIYPVIRLALERGHGVRVISSGQSRENFLMQYRDFGLPENLLVTAVSSEGDLERAGSAFKWFARAMLTSRRKFRGLLLAPDGYVVVHGDTLSTLAGAWLGWRCSIPVVHVEAGLRSAQLFNPFPEEITRRLVSRFASYHMCPDDQAVENLRRTRTRGNIINTSGNTLLDAVLLSGQGLAEGNPGGEFALVNVHRFENLNSDSRWTKIIDTVVRASGPRKIIFVTHPQTRHKLAQDQGTLRRLTHPQIEIRDRMPFSQFIGLLKSATFLLSDGGSNQEECSYLGKPCLLLRESTERNEGLESCCVLSRFDQSVIDRFLDNPRAFASEPISSGSGPSDKILKALEAGI